MQAPFVKCETTNPATFVRTEKMVPDLAMTNFEGERIVFGDLKFDSKLGKYIHMLI